MIISCDSKRPSTPGGDELPPCGSESKQLPSISAELFNIPLDDGRYLVYAPLRRAAFITNAAMVNFLSDLCAGTLHLDSETDRELITFLRALEIVDGGIETSPNLAHAGDPCPTAVTLFLTTACNLRCTYCYASAGDKPARFMSLAVAKRGIEFVSTNAKNKDAGFFRVAYHGGGEPTVHWNVLTESFRYAQERAHQLDLELYATATTNGVLLEEQVDWIIRNLRSVTLSCDGLPQLQDQNRLTVLAQGSSAQVMRTIHQFEGADFNYGIRMTVTPDQIERIPESVEFLCCRTRRARIQIEPAFQLGRWKEGAEMQASSFVAAFRKGQACAFRYGREMHFSTARVGLLSNHFCGVTQDTFALSPEGNVSACYEVFSEEDPNSKTFFYGSPSAITRGYTFQLPILNNLRKQTVQNREYCQGCFAKWSCSGDCYHRVLKAAGDKEFNGMDRCEITRELTKDQILRNIASAGGWFWHEKAEKCSIS